ncbi:hypothetical protein ACHAWX_002075 [Stephanocyclus meneghinianus]
MPPNSSRAASRVKTLRKSKSSLSEHDYVNAEKVMVQRADSMSSRASAGEPFTDDELDDVMNSLHNITPHDASIDWDALRRLFGDIAHLSHKEWHVTDENADKMAKILTPNGLTPEASQMFERILHEGNWDGALAFASMRNDDKLKRFEKTPWAVLVTGVNGIRKTTAMYQPWFSKALYEALIPPHGMKVDFDTSSLPTGDNSFFRQLDHMITTLCNEDFSLLYALTGAQLTSDEENLDPPKELIQKYSSLKASIFSRYRTLSELLGVLLLKEAQNVDINVICETSGRDVAMFHYIDHFFGKKSYNKLAIHFKINDLRCAMQSVDKRMVKEIKAGKNSLSGNTIDVIYVNGGGPYGSEVLASVQKDSDQVWKDVVSKEHVVGKDWYRATLEIEAHASKPWTVRAVRADGSYGTRFEFGGDRNVC